MANNPLSMNLGNSLDKVPGDSFKMPSLFKGEGDHILNSNIDLLKSAGYSHPRAVRTALAHKAKFGGRSVKMIPLRVNPIKKLRLKAPGVLPEEV